MKPAFRHAYIASLFMWMLLLSGCDAIGTIFKAGAWTGAIVVIAIIGVVVWLFSRLFGGGRKV